MKQISLVPIFLALGSSAFAQKNFTGEIMDKQCAVMSSHDNMMRSEGARSAKECALACVKGGGSFALMDTRTKKVYPIEDEKKVRDFAGERVQITGSYDEDAGVLQIKSITRAQ